MRSMGTKVVRWTFFLFHYLSASSRTANVVSLPVSLARLMYQKNNKQKTKQKNAACFSHSACTPLAANLSTNQLLISSICFSSMTSLIGTPMPCWHPKYLCSFPTTPFLLWHSSVSNPFRQSKLPGQRSFAYQDPTVWNKLPHSIRHASSTASFKTAPQTKLCCQQNVSQYISFQKSG